MTSPAPHDRLYFEDVSLDLELESPAVTVTEAHVGLFGGLTDDRPHDAQAVPELLPVCISSGLGWRLAGPPLAVLAFMGFEWRFLRPVRVGDTVHCVSKSVGKRLLREGGVVIEERKVLNQHGEVVQSGKLMLLVAKRPASGGGAAGPS